MWCMYFWLQRWNHIVYNLKWTAQHSVWNRTVLEPYREILMHSLPIISFIQTQRFHLQIILKIQNCNRPFTCLYILVVLVPEYLYLDWIVQCNVMLIHITEEKVFVCHMGCLYLSYSLLWTWPYLTENEFRLILFIPVILEMSRSLNSIRNVLQAFPFGKWKLCLSFNERFQLACFSVF
jgi:hypothetical protein